MKAPVEAAAPADAHASLTEALVRAGILVPTGVPGVYGKGRSFIEAFDGVYSFITSVGSGAKPELFRFPPVMPRDDLVRSDFLRSFPDLVGSIHSFSGGDGEHAELLRTVERAGDWTAHLSPTEVVMSPAACYPLYPIARGRLPVGGRLFDVLGMCFRHEPSSDVTRMQAFHQREYVHLGTPDSARTFRDGWVQRAQELLTDLGLAVHAEIANDPFFGRAGLMLAANQRAGTLKYEVVASIGGGDAPTAIVSCNCHLAHLTIPFGIEGADGETAHSACIGFGMERIVLALFAAHGLDTASWDAAIRHRLWP